MTEHRFRRWRRKLGIAALMALAIAVVGWRAAIYFIERGPSVPSAGAPTCAGRLDPGYAGAAKRARQHLATMVVEREIPGLTVAVAVGDRVVWSEGLGLADRERGVLACPDMQFRIHSVSKALTAAGMMRLVERGVLDLDAPVRTHIPGLPSDLGAVTARESETTATTMNRSTRRDTRRQSPAWRSFAMTRCSFHLTVETPTPPSASFC